MGLSLEIFRRSRDSGETKAKPRCLYVSHARLFKRAAFYFMQVGWALGVSLLWLTVGSLSAPDEDRIWVDAQINAEPDTPAKTAEDKPSLRVIYFGKPQSARQKDFVGFLRQHFVKVDRGDLAAFSEKEAEGYDVVLLDYDELRIANNAIQMPRIPFTAKCSRPIMTLGATGALVCERLRLKTGYL